MSHLKTFHTDLHIHTCLSPCADWEMTPKRIVAKSLDAGLDLIAVCDHNSAENAGAAVREDKRCGLAVLPGMEADLPLDGVEISFRISPAEAKRRFPDIVGRPCITSSDAHYPEEIGRARTKFRLMQPTVPEIRQALQWLNGRSTEI